LTLNADGTFDYVPADGFFGDDEFTYQLDDPSGGATVATVGITVGSVNDAPVAVSDNYSTDEDTTLAGDVLGNDSDVDDVNAALVVSLVSTER